jgi:hypothetical protein
MGRSCITNWARHLPIHVVQQLAGHSEIKTTQHYYMSGRPEDFTNAQAIGESLLGRAVPAGATDQLLTYSARQQAFPGRSGKTGVSQGASHKGLA